MIEVTRTFDVDKEPATVHEFLRDFAHATRWDPGTKRCTRIDDGPIQPGATWHNVSEFRGRETELTYELRTDDEPEHLVFRGTNKTATSTDDITIRPSSGGSTITYTARIQFNGIARLFTPILRREFERLGDETEKQMTSTITNLTPG